MNRINGVSFVRSYPAWFEFERSERGYKKVDETLLLHLPGRRESIWISVRRKNTWWRILCIGWSWNQPLGSLPCVEIRKGKWQILVSEVPKLLLKLVQICPQTPTLRVTLAKGPKDESSKRLPLQMVLDSLWGMYHIFAHKWNGEQERAGAGLTYLNFSASWLIKYKSSSCYCQFNIYPIQSSSPR